MVAMDFFAALNCYDFFNQYCSNLLKNPTVRGLSVLQPKLGWAFNRLSYLNIFVPQLYRILNVSYNI